MSWSDMSLDDYGGTKVLLQRLAASPWVRQSIPNASAVCNQYFSFARKAHEPMTQFLVQEALGFSEFVEALVRLAEEKRGIRQQNKNFGLPAEEADYEQDYDSGWDAWWDGWAEWPQDDANVHDPDNGDFDPNLAQPTTTLPAEGRLVRSPPWLAMSSTSLALQTDSFVLGVLRGFRLLQAAGLSADGRRDILSATHGSLDFDEVSRAWSSWDWADAYNVEAYSDKNTTQEENDEDLRAAQMHVAGSPTPYSISQTTLAMSRSKGSQLTEEQGNQIWDIKTAAADFREKITGSREKEPPRPFHPPRGVGPDPRDPRMNPEQWPCYGEHHLGSVRANPHGQWQHCQVCNIRWMYIVHAVQKKVDADIVLEDLVRRQISKIQGERNMPEQTGKAVAKSAGPTRRMHDLIDLFHYALEELYGREAASDGYNAVELYGINDYGLQRQELLATYRRRQAAHFIEDTLNEDPETDIYWEWPWVCEGWNQRPLEYIAHLLQARGREWLPCRVDGCNYGLRADDGAGDFLRKRWMIRTTSSFFHQRFKAKVCPGSHRHAWRIQGAETSKSSYYPWRMVKSMALAWRQEYVSNRNMQLIFAKEDKPYMIPIEDEISMERTALQAINRHIIGPSPTCCHALPRAWECIGLDTSEWPVPGLRKKASFLLIIDLATKLRVVVLLKLYPELAMQPEATDEIVQALVQGWLGHYPRPKLVVADNAKSFISSKDFLQSENIQVHYPPEKEPWSHGIVEAAVADIKHMATAIHQENLNNSPEMTLTLAASADKRRARGGQGLARAGQQQDKENDKEVPCELRVDHLRNVSLTWRAPAWWGGQVKVPVYGVRFTEWAALAVTQIQGGVE
ncbi:unnamed protein product [Durusdinium trenchii]|uniref:Integrase catalytic domain-containing protein n=1 Tax=Durusdinium trenchii TaxID=1381693 RepID=A0ABP0MGY0_9DINO